MGRKEGSLKRRRKERRRGMKGETDKGEKVEVLKEERGER